MENKYMPIPDYYREMSESEFVLRIMMARVFFREALNILFYSDDEYMRVYKDEEMVIDAEMFSEYCEHIRVLYQAYYESEKRDRHEILCMLEAFSMLEKIASFGEVIIDEEHDIISEIAYYAVSAILQIGQFEHKYDIKWASVMCHVVYEGVFFWYDFENDTPQDVWDRFANGSSD